MGGGFIIKLNPPCTLQNCLGDVAVAEPHRRDRQLCSAKFLQTTQKQFRSAKTNCAKRIT
jgi:hypothetical protein